jgi:hypothetical protein
MAKDTQRQPVAASDAQTAQTIQAAQPPAAQIDTQTQPLPASTNPAAAAPLLPVIGMPATPTVPVLPSASTGRVATSAEESVRMGTEPKPVTSVDPQQLQSTGDNIRQTFVDAIADLTGTAREALAQAADYFVPLIAEQTLLQQQATTPAAQVLAARNKRHLEGRLLMQAGQYGIQLEQRQESRLLGIVDALIASGSKLI